MAWDITKPAGGDSANTIDNSAIANFTALDTWASAITDGVAAAGSTVLKAYRAANAVIAKFRAAAGDVNDRYRFDLNGQHEWGDGTATPDVALTRGGADFLQMASGDQIRVQQDPVNANDLARKSYVDTAGGALSKARASQSVGLTVSNDTLTAVGLGAESFDTANYHDNTVNNNRMTIPTTAKYLIIATAGFTANTAGERRLVIRDQGATIWGETRQNTNQASAGREWVGNVSTIVSLTAADWIEMAVSQNSGAGLTLTSAHLEIISLGA